MSRVHEHIQKAGEMIFCDSTSTLARFNTSLFIVSTSHPAGGIPLAVIITPDEQKETPICGVSLLKEVLPNRAFHSHEVEQGPLAMIDDSSAERNALHSVWRDTLCSFHFLQNSIVNSYVLSVQDSSQLIFSSYSYTTKWGQVLVDSHQLNALYSCVKECTSTYTSKMKPKRGNIGMV